MEMGPGRPGRAGTGLACVQRSLGTPVPMPQAQGLWGNWVDLLLIQQSSLITKTGSCTYPIFSVMLIYFQVDC